MWCENCQADRAAAASAESKVVTCATCGAELTSQHFGKLDQQMQKARELLDRWSKEPLLEPYSPLPEKQASHLAELRESETSDVEKEPISESVFDSLAEDTLGEQFEQFITSTRQPQRRYDTAHGSRPENPSKSEPPERKPEVSGPGDQSDERRHAETIQPETPIKAPPGDGLIENMPTAESIAEFHPSTPAVQPRYRKVGPKNHRTDPPLEQAAPAPHLNIQQLIEERLEQNQRKVNWMMMGGQWLAYLGVLAMTAGGAVIVFGYFGGAAGMTPRGWMLTTAGQMLLFLGIITLISSGMERSTEEINDRIEVLGEQLLRFESETRANFLKGPKLPPGSYAEDADFPEPEPVEEEVQENS